MSLVFFIALFVFLIAGYIFKHSADEISYLAAAISLISLVLSLVLAPWPIQLLLLIFVLLSNRQQAQLPTITVEPQEEEKPKLTYRGVSYELTPRTIEEPKTEVTGKYRGQVWTTQSDIKVSEVQPTSNLEE